MLRKFIKRNGNGFTSCYICASKDYYTNEWDAFLYTDCKYGLPICYKCIQEMINNKKDLYDYVIVGD